MIESPDAAMIQRPSLLKAMSLMPPAQPQSSRIVRFVSVSTTRIHPSSQVAAKRSDAGWYKREVIFVIGAQSNSSTRYPVLKSQNLSFPSIPLEMTVLFKLSTTRPVTLPVCLPNPGENFWGLAFPAATRAF